jgi:hypothetical protein
MNTLRAFKIPQGVHVDAVTATASQQPYLNLFLLTGRPPYNLYTAQLERGYFGTFLTAIGVHLSIGFRTTSEVEGKNPSATIQSMHNRKKSSQLCLFCEIL